MNQINTTELIGFLQQCDGDNPVALALLQRMRDPLEYPVVTAVEKNSITYICIDRDANDYLPDEVVEELETNHGL